MEKLKKNWSSETEMIKMLGNEVIRRVVSLK